MPEDEAVTKWTLLLVAVVLALPVGYVVADVSKGSEEPAPRAAIVLPAGATQDASPRPGRGSRTPDAGPSPERPEKDLCDDDPADDSADDAADAADDAADDKGDDKGDDDDGVEVVRPCPDDFGDDDDDDDRGERTDD